MEHRILAIEDDRDALANLRDILELDGHQVTGACTLKEATERRSWSEFAVILMDRKLPDGNADTILPFIRQAAPHAAVIVITGHTELDGTIAAIRNGAADYLLKPINPDLLRAAVARAMKIREMEERMLQSERLAAIGQMIAVLTHESGNVLCRSGGLAETLAVELEDRPDLLELVDGLQKAQSDLRRLYEEVRNYASPIELDRDLWKLGSIWRQTWSNVMVTQDNKKNASLVESIAGIDLSCAVDSFRLDQVFRNLFENSLAASPDPVRVEIACSDTAIDGQAALRVSIRDNGPGLTGEQVERVFAPFYTTKQKGTGLGMAIVKRIIEAHGGNIVVGSEPFSGAEFVITLPRE